MRKLLVINNAEPADRSFNEPLFEAVAGLADYEVVEYRDIPPYAQLRQQYGGVILSGVPLHYGFETIDDRLPYLDWIRQTEMPVLGICLGHENIGRLFGATVIDGEEAEEGPCQLRIVQDDPLFQGLGSTMAAMTLHSASMTVPTEFQLLASSAVCINEVMRHAERPIYGLQFHPESSADGCIMLHNFAALAQSFQLRRVKTFDLYLTRT
jgi:GMP synthase (glutamine-hydrolysing)